MGFYIVKGDMLDYDVDALVVPTTPKVVLQGVLGTRIKNLGGELLISEIEQLKEMKFSETAIVNAYNMKCKKLIFVANPQWFGGKNNEEKLLVDSYKNCIATARKFHLKSIGFPLLSSGIYGCPKSIAIEAALEDNMIKELKDDPDFNSYLFIYDKNTYLNYYERLNDDNIVIDGLLKAKSTNDEISCFIEEHNRLGWYKKAAHRVLNGKVGPTFYDKLTYYMNKKCLTPSQCYDKVMSQTYFSQISKDPKTSKTKVKLPTKYTAIALGINMGLYYEEISDLLVSIGEFISEDNPRDNVIAKGIGEGKGVYAINEDLHTYHMDLLPYNYDKTPMS